jgi:hypothetical protein
MSARYPVRVTEIELKELRLAGGSDRISDVIDVVPTLEFLALIEGFKSMIARRT